MTDGRTPDPAKASPPGPPDRELQPRQELLIELTNAYFEGYRYDYPNLSQDELTAKCRKMAEDDLDEVIAIEKAALLQRVRRDVVGESEPTKDTLPNSSARHRLWARNALRAAQRKVLDNIIGGEDE